jgi:hypothetical protein
MQRAQTLTAARNLDAELQQGATQGELVLDAFSVLHRFSDSHIASVAHDSGLAFAVEMGSESEILSFVRAKERAQAALALGAGCCPTC